MRGAGGRRLPNPGIANDAAMSLKRWVPVCLLLGTAAVAGGPALASEYDWRDPGTKETEAVLACLRDGDAVALDTLMEDGLEVDQLLPLGGHHVPTLSLALSTGRIGIVEHLLEEGADVDTISTRETRQTESVQHNVRVRTS